MYYRELITKVSESMKPPPPLDRRSQREKGKPTIQAATVRTDLPGPAFPAAVATNAAATWGRLLESSTFKNKDPSSSVFQSCQYLPGAGVGQGGCGGCSGAEPRRKAEGKGVWEM